MTTSKDDRLNRLLGFLEADPLNPDLLGDAVETALGAGEIERASALNARLREVRPDAFAGHYLAGLIAMHRGDFVEAVAILEPLAEDNDHPPVRFNLAWSKAMTGAKVQAHALLDDGTVAAIPAAAMLKLQLMHEAGAFEEAEAFGREALRRHPDDRGLLAAMATLAMDLEDLDLARECAQRAGDHPEALAAAAMLELQDGHPHVARGMFDRSLSVREHNPRAWIGRGLSALLEREPGLAAADIDRGAQQLGDHIGSWIAAGWAHFLAGDADAAGQRFERALAIDHNFAESHGSLAVVDVTRGNLPAAKKRLATALKLDKECFSAVLAQVLIAQDDPTRAREIVDQAVNFPLNESGVTIASYMAGLSRPTLH